MDVAFTISTCEALPIGPTDELSSQILVVNDLGSCGSIGLVDDSPTVALPGKALNFAFDSLVDEVLLVL